MQTDLPQIKAGSSVRAAFERLQAQPGGLSLLVQAQGGQACGYLSAERLLHFLFDGEAASLEQGRLPDNVLSRLDVPLEHISLDTAVFLRPDDNLASMLQRFSETQASWLAVSDGERVVGQVSLQALYLATASLALSGDSGASPFEA
jgi:hypothetical protein